MCATKTCPQPQPNPARHSRLRRNDGEGRDNKPKQPTESPSPLTGEDQSLSQCLTLGAEGENDAPHRHVIADLIRNPEVKGGGPGPSYWLQGSIHKRCTASSRHCGLDPQSRGATGRRQPTPSKPPMKHGDAAPIHQQSTASAQQKHKYP